MPRILTLYLSRLIKVRIVLRKGSVAAKSGSSPD